MTVPEKLFFEGLCLAVLKFKVELTEGFGVIGGLEGKLLYKCIYILCPLYVHRKCEGVIFILAAAHRIIKEYFMLLFCALQLKFSYFKAIGRKFP